MPGEKELMLHQEHEQLVKVSLKVKVITFISLIVLVVGTCLSWYFLHQTKRVLADELQERSLSLTKNLAHNSKYGVLTEDEILLQELIQGILQEDSVLFVLISNAQGRVLAQQFKEHSLSPTSRPVVELAMQHALALLPAITSPSVHYHIIGDQGIYHTAAPVETTETPTSKSEKQLATAFLLLGKESGAASPTSSQPFRLGSVQIIMSLEKMHENVQKALMAGIGLTLGIVGIGVLISFFFCGYALTPIQAMVQAASRIAAGDLSQRVEVHSRDEIGALALTFNRMTESLDRMTHAQQHRLAELSALHAIGLVLSSTLDLDQVIDSALAAIVEHVGYDRAKLFLVDHEKQALVQGKIAGASADIQAQLRQMEISLQKDQGFHVQVVRSGEPVLVEDMEKVREHAYEPLATLLGTIHSFLIVPLKLEDHILGVMSVDNFQTSRKLIEADLRLLVTLANQIAIAIANALAYRQIEQLNISLEEKVRKRTEELELQHERLRIVNSQLEMATRHKSEFLANMSHELRTPLNAIMGFTRLVMRRSKGLLPQRQYENLEKIIISSDHLLALINDILDLSKIESGRMEVQPVRFALHSLVDQCFHTVEPLIKSERLRLQKNIEEDLPLLLTDQEKVKQILMNLLSNALKFTEEGTITLTAQRRGTQIAITVSDTGIGIPEDKLELIFEEFRRVDSGTTRRYGGTGLGLSISRRLAQLLGGNITVQSTPGVGSSFTVTFPISYKTPQPLVPHIASSEPVLIAPETDKLVLAIDDDPDVIYLLQENLTEAGYRVIGAVNSEEGLQQARNLRPFAIILDILMPQKDGWQLLHDLKADETTRDIPVIVLSIVDNKELGYQLGVYDYLLKPFEREALLASLARIPS